MKKISPLSKYCKSLKKIIKKLYIALRKFCRKTIAHIRRRLTSWWHVIIAVFCVIVFLYYPIGGWLINNTSTPSYQPQNASGKLSSLDALIYLTNRETRHKIWTPNLPVLFPSYFLDNMPNFQLGVMSAVSHTATTFSRLNIKTSDATIKDNLLQAAELLQYPGTIWLVSPQNHLIPAPSSSTQYKKGARLLKVLNQSISEGKSSISCDSLNFAFIMKSIRRDLTDLTKRTADHIREHQSSFFDFKSDDIFYYAFGKIYAYAQITKGLGYDFKETLVKYDIYSTWTSLLKTLDETSELEPMIVRNGQLKSSFSPNHLAVINYQTSLSINYINTILNKLSQQLIN